MAKLPTKCPSCEASVNVTRLTCPNCKTNLDGIFRMPGLLHLSEDELRFVTEFVMASGSLKEMAKLRKQSYPTIRNRLNDIIEKLRQEETDQEKSQMEILDAISTGKMSVQEAIQRLRGEHKDE
jgi:hypothetical protein